MTMPGFCPTCGHATAMHSSAGCLWSITGLGCQCSADRDTAGGVDTTPQKIGH